MKTQIRLTTCPSCSQPLAAVTHGASRAATWHAISPAGLIDLDADALTWCPRCRAALPAQAAPAPAQETAAA